MDKNISFYVVHLLGNLSIIVAFIGIYIILFKQDKSETFFEIATNGKQNSRDRNTRTYPWYRVDRLWRCVVILWGFLGVWYISYSLLKQMFSWMPYAWRTDGEWLALTLSEILSFFVAIGLCAAIFEINNRLVYNPDKH